MTENLTKTNWKFLENRTWYAIMHVFMSFQANFTIESAKYIYIYQTFQIWNLQRAPRRSRARKLSWKKSDKIDSVFFMHYLLKIMNFMHVHASARTPDKRAEKFDKSRCVLHFEPLKYLQNAWS